MNSFYMMLDVRENIGERFSAEKHWLDVDLQRKLNSAQSRVRGIIAQSPGDWLVKSTALTPVASKITLPSDCARPVYMEESVSGVPISFGGSVRERRVNRVIGSTLDSGVLEAYFEDLYLVVNQDSYTTVVTLWYEKRVPNLAFGVIAAGAASSLTMETVQAPPYVDDYFNGVVVETMGATNYEIKLRSEVSDYVASTRIMTVTGTPTTSDFYGTVSALPEEADRLIILDTTIALMAKPSSAIDPKYFEYWNAERRREEKDLREWLSQRASANQHVRDTGDE